MNAGRVEEAISMVEDMRSGIMKVGAVSSHLACDRPLTTGLLGPH